MKPLHTVGIIAVCIAVLGVFILVMAYLRQSATRAYAVQAAGGPAGQKTLAQRVGEGIFGGVGAAGGGTQGAVAGVGFANALGV